MTVYESELPGVGKKFEVELGDEGRLVIVTHNTGKREVFRRDRPDEDAEKLFELSDRMARQVGTILEGAYFQPIQSERIETVLEDDTVIEWAKVADDSELVGESLAEARLRQATGASVIAIRRGDATISNPTAETTIQAEDVLVALGTREACRALLERAAGEDGQEFDVDES